MLTDGYAELLVVGWWVKGPINSQINQCPSN